jgi:thiol-disulfide isomerase/thioredoxin
MMPNIKRFLIGLAVAIAALLAGVYAGHKKAATNISPNATTTLATGSISRLFASTLDDTDEKPQAFSQWKGKTLVVNFWATWCPPCREEMPGFSRLHAKNVVNGVQFVGIALDSKESTQQFARQYPVSYPLLIGGDEGTVLARQLGNVQLAMPYTVIIGTDGEARFTRLGSLSEQELDKLLKETAGR